MAERKVPATGWIERGDPKGFPRELYYARATIRNRLAEWGHYYDDRKALEILADAWRTGVPLERLNAISRSIDVRTWSDWRAAVYAAADESEAAGAVARRNLEVRLERAIYHARWAIDLLENVPREKRKFIADVLRWGIPDESAAPDANPMPNAENGPRK